MSRPLQAAYNRSWFIFLLVVTLSAPIPAAAQTNPQVLFDRANDKLQNGNYLEALSTYKTIRDRRQVSGPLFLNMAISYVQLDSLGKAKYYLIKAREFEETSQRAEKGLEYVESRFSRQSAVLPKLPWERFFDWLGTVVGPVTLLGIGILMLNLGVSAYVGGWFLERWSTPLHRGGIATAVFSLLLLLSSFYLKYLETRYSPAVMVHRQADVVQKPDEDATLISQAYEGYTFTVDHARSSEQQGWYYVRMSNGLYGWIPAGEIMIL